MGKPLTGKRKRGHAVRRQKALEPKMVEDDKVALLIRGTKCSEVGLQLMRDVRALKAPNAILFSRKNDILPFEDETKLEFLCQKNDASLFMFASHNKKRPNNIVIGRLFDGHLLDMFEFGASNFESFTDVLKRNGGHAKALGSQSCILFQGDEFEKDHKMKVMKSVLLDFFRGRTISELDIPNIDHCIVVSAHNEVVAIRNYVVGFQKPKAVGGVVGKPIPRLIEMGPSVDLNMRRHRLAASALTKVAHKKPKLAKEAKKKKNVTRDSLEGTVGRIHMEKQNLQKLVTRSRFSKSLKRKTAQA